MIFVYALLALVIAFVLIPVLIPTLKRMEFDQSIREGGPQSHMKKTGAPTMGGLTFLLGIVITSLVAIILVDQTNPIILLLFVTIGFGLIGFIDDYIIVVRKNNQGLTSKQKFLVQIGITTIFFVLSNVFHLVNFSTSIHIPFTNVTVPLSFAYVIFIVFWQVGFSNAVSLTDGLDGLATESSIIGLTVYAIMSLVLGEAVIGIFCIIMLSALLESLSYNINLIKVFMGDTGSLALGGIFAAISIMLNQELSLIFIGLVFVVETLSVMLQVTNFRLTGKRVFKMSPIHHHFELIGWSKWKIVTVFWVVSLISGLISLWIRVH